MSVFCPRRLATRITGVVTAATVRHALHYKKNSKWSKLRHIIGEDRHNTVKCRELVFARQLYLPYQIFSSLLLLTSTRMYILPKISIPIPCAVLPPYKQCTPQVKALHVLRYRDVTSRILCAPEKCARKACTTPKVSVCLKYSMGNRTKS